MLWLIRYQFPIPAKLFARTFSNAGMSVNQLAKALGITATRLNDVVRGRRESLPIPLCAWRDTSGLRPNSG